MMTSVPKVTSSETFEHKAPNQVFSPIKPAVAGGSNSSPAIQDHEKDHPEAARMRQLEAQGQSLSEIAVTLGVPETEVLSELGLSESGTSASSQSASNPVAALPVGFSVKA